MSLHFFHNLRAPAPSPRRARSRRGLAYSWGLWVQGSGLLPWSEWFLGLEFVWRIVFSDSGPPIIGIYNWSQLLADHPLQVGAHLNRILPQHLTPGMGLETQTRPIKFRKTSKPYTLQPCPSELNPSAPNNPHVECFWWLGVQTLGFTFSCTRLLILVFLLLHAL